MKAFFEHGGERVEFDVGEGMRPDGSVGPSRRLAVKLDKEIFELRYGSYDPVEDNVEYVVISREMVQ